MLKSEPERKVEGLTFSWESVNELRSQIPWTLYCILDSCYAALKEGCEDSRKELLHFLNSTVQKYLREKSSLSLTLPDSVRLALEQYAKKLMVQAQAIEDDGLANDASTLCELSKCEESITMDAACFGYWKTYSM